MYTVYALSTMTDQPIAKQPSSIVEFINHNWDVNTDQAIKKQQS